MCVTHIKVIVGYLKKITPSRTPFGKINPLLICAEKRTHETNACWGSNFF